jgi:hypothetical protein
MERVKARADETCNSDLVVVPTGCTSILQAPDLSWKKPFKEKYTDLWNEWSVGGGDKSYTPAGTCELLQEKPALNGEASVGLCHQGNDNKSFKSAGITTATDGRVDYLAA